LRACTVGPLGDVAGGRGEVGIDSWASLDRPDGRREECCWLCCVAENEFRFETQVVLSQALVARYLCCFLWADEAANGTPRRRSHASAILATRHTAFGARTLKANVEVPLLVLTRWPANSPPSHNLGLPVLDRAVAVPAVALSVV
jgi:hypothetical protein